MTADAGAAFVAALNSRSADAVRATLSPRFAGKANGRALDGEAQVRLVESFWTGFPDGVFQCEAVGGSGRKVLTWSLAGTHGGDYLGIPATGQRVTLSGFTIAVWDATGLLSLDWKWDTKSFASQVLGPDDLPDSLLPPPQHRPDPSLRWARDEQRRRGPQRGGPRKQGKGQPQPGRGQGQGRGKGRGRGGKPKDGQPGAPPADAAAPAAAAPAEASPAPAPSPAPSTDAPAPADQT